MRFKPEQSDRRERVLNTSSDENSANFEEATIVDVNEKLTVKYELNNILVDVNFQMKFYETLKPIVKRIIALKTAVCFNKLNVVSIDSGEKRIKAQIMKTALGKSDAGRSILAMLAESQDGLKLIG